MGLVLWQGISTEEYFTACKDFSASIEAGRRGLGTRQLVTAFATGTGSQLTQRTRRTRTLVTHEITQVMAAAKRSATRFGTLPVRSCTIALFLVPFTLAKLQTLLATRRTVAWKEIKLKVRHKETVEVQLGLWFHV
jgi:hypothetical protein